MVIQEHASGRVRSRLLLSIRTLVPYVQSKEGMSTRRRCSTYSMESSRETDCYHSDDNPVASRNPRPLASKLIVARNHLVGFELVSSLIWTSARQSTRLPTWIEFYGCFVRRPPRPITREEPEIRLLYEDCMKYEVLQDVIQVAVNLW